MARVLVVDEEPMLRLLLRLVLENDGHDVRDTDDARDALIHIGGWNPDVVVTELKMPGMDGTELLRRMRMRSASGKMRIVVTSAIVPAGVEVDAVFAKPYEARTVADEIDSLLGAPAHDGAGRAGRVRHGSGDRASRAALLSDIWSRLVSVDSQADGCDGECDAALGEIRRLAAWVEERSARNLRELAGAGTRPDSESAALGR